MRKELAPVHKEIASIVKNSLIKNLHSAVEEQKSFIRSLEGDIETYYHNLDREKKNGSLKDIIEENKKFHTDIFSRIKERYPVQSGKLFNEEFKEFTLGINDYLSTVDEEIYLVQEDERFVIYESDPSFLKFKKHFKKLFYNISQIPVYSGNFFRKIFKKELKPENKWHHKVPLRKITSYFYKEDFFGAILPELQKMYPALSSTSNRMLKAVKNIGEQFFDIINKYKNDDKAGLNFEEIDYRKEADSAIQQLDRLKDELAGNIIQRLEEEYPKFENAYLKVNTIELSGGRFSQRKINKKNKELNGDFYKINSRWNNTLFALYDFWRLTEELSIVKDTILKEYFTAINNCSDKISNKIMPQIKQISSRIKSSINKIKNAGENSKDLKKILIEERKSNKAILSEEIVPEILETILAQNIPSVIDEIEVKLAGVLRRLSKKRAVVKTHDYNEPLKDSDLDSISPYELLAFETAPVLLKRIKKLKSEIIDELETAQKNILELEKISDFNIESAIVILEEKDNNEEPVQLAVEGLERALAKTEEIKISLTEADSLIADELGKSVTDFNKNLISITNPEEVFQIKVRVAKAKALERTAKMRADAARYIKNAIPAVTASVKKKIAQTKIFTGNLKKRLGLTTKPTVISSEVSDFLAETQSAIMKLPFVYQRLFQLEALTDERFFEGRESEIKRLNSAYENWLNGFFAPSVIVGEKGSGSTSLINIFIKNLEAKYPVINLVIGKSIPEEKKLLEFLSSKLEISAESSEDIILNLNSLPSKRIIILENMQHLFLRKVSGFSSLKMLLKIISATNKNVFWIITSALYSWQYLDKVLTIPDYFAYIIKLENLEFAQITEIILRRHRVSGYNIYF